MNPKYSIFLILILSFFQGFCKNNDTIFFNNKNILLENIYNFSVYEDQTNQLTASQVLKVDSFKLNLKPSPNFGLTNSSFWIKLKINNTTSLKKLILGTSNAIIDTIELYELATHNLKKITLGDCQPYKLRIYNYQSFLFDIKINQNSTKEYLLKIKGWEQLILPLALGSEKSFFESNIKQDLIFGVFFGIMLVLMLYNFFIYLSVKDSAYLFYVIYILFITLTQSALNGYSYRFLFPNNPQLSNISLILFNCIAGLATIRFIQLFLKTKENIPKLNFVYYFIATIYISGIIVVLMGFYQFSYRLMDLGGGIISFFSLFIAIKMALKGNRYAKFFLFAWSFFLVGVILFVMKNSGILPSNNFTNYTMTLGISIEGIILSIALADRINIYKKERLEALEEKEKLVREQNVILEQQVEERTSELNKTLNNLKDTQSQLVEAEKMSSLGQLTAGIAHEINNPINFVSSNVSPLRQDLDDIYAIINKYEELNLNTNIEDKLAEIEHLKNELDFEYLKTEIPTIINGIEDGANRTKEIVSGLRNFSRLDEADLQTVNINEGIKSTLILIKSKFHSITVEKDLGSLPTIECYPSKLNQLFMNIIDNAIDAVTDKVYDNELPKIIIRSFVKNNNVCFAVQDNGIGMSEETKEKIFEPFYTTKDVGKGTGLGMAIVYGILEQHNAKINIETKLNIGTTILIEIPINR